MPANYAPGIVHCLKREITFDLRAASIVTFLVPKSFG
jgi:hypothetical protein